jgi:HPt (histidine-containing phosphotransfer) domain-containing protein
MAANMTDESRATSGTSPVSTEVLDDLRSVFGDAPSDVMAFHDLLQVFVEGMRSHLSDAESALLAGDAIGVQRAAHQLLGNCGVVGANRLAKYAADLERHGAADRLELASEAWHSVEAEADQVEAAVRAAMNTGSER